MPPLTVFFSSLLVLQIFVGAWSADESESTSILPKLFGNFTFDDLTSAPSCGTTMASYNGVPAKSNGNYQGTGTSCSSYGTYGSQYQCVEYAQRYFGTVHGTTPIWYGNAIDLCSSHPSNVKTTTSPKAGDLVVFNFQPYGHVAVISSISGSSINVVEQNASPTGKNTYSSSSVKCYLTYGSSTGSCTHLGYYCGNDGLSKDANTLYYCSGAGATPTVKTSCPFTCVTMPSGYDDVCSSSTDSCAGTNNGYYCGGDKAKGDSNTLYYCVSQKPQGAKKCSSGCVVAASGQNDYCK